MRGSVVFVLTFKVGGVNLVSTSPEAVQAFDDLKRAGMLSPTARCHTFSDAADGYVRSEGGCLFLLKSSALASELPCRARIVGSAVNQNGPRKPLTAVDPVSQERVIRAACADAGVTPAALAAVEMHGTGTRLGDPVEYVLQKKNCNSSTVTILALIALFH